MLNAKFEADGPIGALPIEGKGVTRITAGTFTIVANWFRIILVWMVPHVLVWVPYNIRFTTYGI